MGGCGGVTSLGQGAGGGSKEENAGDGGAGGKGGTGGQGGQGGAGAGGPSFGIYADAELSTNPAGTTVMGGTPGPGGTGPSDDARGANGVAKAVQIGALQ
jgi:hypothetical protein